MRAQVAELSCVSTGRHACNATAFDPSGKAVAVACDDAVVRCYEVGGESALLQTMAGHTDSVQCLAFGVPNGQGPGFMVTGGSDQTFRIWS